MHLRSIQNQRQYHLILASNFLKNVSLDGSHEDTNLRIFKRPGLAQAEPKLSIPEIAIEANVSNTDGNDRGFDTSLLLKRGNLDKDGTDSESDCDSESGWISVAGRRFKITKAHSGGGSESGSNGRRRSDTSTLGPKLRHESFNVLALSKKTIVETKKSWRTRRRHKSTRESSTSAEDTPGPRNSSFVHKLSVFLGASPSPSKSQQPSPQPGVDTLSPLLSETHVKMRNSGDALHSSGLATESKGPERELEEERIQMNEQCCRALMPFDLRHDEEISYSCLLESRNAGAESRGSVQKKWHSLERLDEKIDPEDPFSSPPASPGAHKYSLAMSSASTSPYHQLHGHKEERYDPCVFSDPHFGPATHKTTLSFPSFISSIIDYVNPNDLKREINEKFREQFPTINLTYSKLKSLKDEMKNIAESSNMDLISLAYAYVYFEKVLLKGLVDKSNRKPICGVCMLLSGKLNDIRGGDVETLITTITSAFRLSVKELVAFELPVMVALDFSLFLQVGEVYPHYQKMVCE